ncbi:MAG: fibronectin type III domain-containing protein [Acutalibacteraceae bacterium]
MKPDKNKAIKNSPEINLIEVQGDFKVYLEWDLARGADKYTVARSDKEEGPYSRVIQLSYDITSYTDTSVEHEGAYWYKIIAYKKTNAEKPLKKAGMPVCANITTMKTPVLKKAGNKKNKRIEISWKNGEKVTGYNIFRRFDFMKKPMLIASVDADKTSYVDTDFVNGQLFYYSVQSVIEEESDVRYSNPSNELCSICFDKVKIMQVKRKHRKKVEFSLRLTAGADGYILFKSGTKNGEYSEVSRTEGISALDCIDKGKKGEKSAYYKVACYKKTDDREFHGPMSESVFVKYKI